SGQSSLEVALLSHNYSAAWSTYIMNRTMKTLRPFCLLCWLRVFVLPMWLVCTTRAQSTSDVGWSNYSNDPGGTRYSPAAQIDRGNVAQLKVAWTFRTGALPHDEELDKKAAFEATPILVNGKLFLSTPYDHVIALNAETDRKSTRLNSSHVKISYAVFCLK